MTLEATNYVNAAARCMNMSRMYKSAGTKRMDARADAMNEKLQSHIEKIMELTGLSWSDAREAVQQRYEQVFC